jgi:predicted DNA-binding transcriptional regulator YafY
MSRGQRESHWLVLRRCLAIVRRLQRGPAAWPELVAAVLREDPAAYGRTEGQPLYKRFRHDLTRLRDSLGVDIRADRRSKTYTILDTTQPLLDVSDEDLTTLAWLEQSFGPTSPRYHAIHDLLGRLTSYLSPERRRHLANQRTALILDLGQRDEDRLDPAVEEKLQEALQRRRRVEFAYTSPLNPDGLSRRHVVDIYEPAYFDAERGHYYVYGYCHYAVTPIGLESVETYVAYRLGRIRHLTLLPQKLPPSPPLPQQYPVKYWLAASVARGGVTQHRWIIIARVEPEGEGVIVHGTTPHPFFAVQELMHYRENCRVLGGPELLQRMRDSVARMAALYGIIE